MTAPEPLPRPQIESFKVRAHHMETLQELLLGALTVDALCTAMDDTIERNLYTSTNKHAYVVDLVGENGEGRQRFNDGFRSFYQRFMELPAEHPVTIASSKDAVCDSCYFGEHCEASITDKESRDYDSFKSFRSTARKLGLNDSYTYSFTPQSSPKLSADGMTITTSADTVRTVIGHPDFAGYGKQKEAKQKEAKRMEQYEKVSEVALSALTRYNHATYPLRRLKPLVVSYMVWSVGLGVFHAGTGVQAYHDSEKMRGAQALAVAEDANKAFDKIPDDYLRFALAGIAYLAIPRRRMHKDTAERPTPELDLL